MPPRSPFKEGLGVPVAIHTVRWLRDHLCRAASPKVMFLPRETTSISDAGKGIMV